MNDLIPLLEEKADSLRAKIGQLQERMVEVDRELRRHQEQLIHVEALLKEERGQIQGQLPEEPLFSMPAIRRSAGGHRSIPQLVAELLAEKGRPMHADEIKVELEARGHKFSAKDAKASVVTALIRGRNKGQFEQVGRNTFRLRVIQHQNPLSESERQEDKDG